MSHTNLIDHDEYNRWYDQAKYTVCSAQNDLEKNDFVWASFKFQQAGEYAGKALLRALGLPARGHSILMLLKELAEQGLEITEEVKSAARELDRHYIPPRYPDAFPSGSPYEFYDQKTAYSAFQAANTLIDFVQALKEGLERDA
jgi:HEPN domain-containing protein